MKIINKIGDAFKDHPRLTVIALLLVLFIIIMIIYSVAGKYLNYSETVNRDYYVYIGKVKHEFTAQVTTNKKGVISKFEADKNINFASNPIYSMSEIVFPVDEIIMFPNDNYKVYRTYPYTVLIGDKLITKDFSGTLSDYFIYDGANTYWFSDTGTLVVDGKNIDLSRHSYVICADDKVEYYDYENDEYGTVAYLKSVTYSTDSYTVNLANDKVGSQGNLIPKSIEYIDFISKY